MPAATLIWLAACNATLGTDTGDSSVTVPDSAGDTEDTTEVPDPPALCINEIMEDNETTLSDETGATPSWIELHNPERGEVSLAGWSLSDDLDEPDRHVFDEALSLPGLGFLVLYADDQPALGSHHLGFELSRLGGTLTLFDPDGVARDEGHWIDEWYSDVARARETDCCTTTPCWASVREGTPGESNEVHDIEDVPLLEAGSTWRYDDQGTSLGTTWREAGFDDSAWASGPSAMATTTRSRW